MRNALFLIMLVTITSMFSQIPERTILKGKINVPNNAEAANINIFNLNSEKGTTTNAIGEFLIRVKEGDHIVVTSIQFQKFEVEITKEIINEKFVVIQINENVNQLNEVTVSTSELSGNLRVDVNKINTKESSFNIDDKEVINTYDANFTIDTQIRSENIGIQDEYLQNGMDFVEIFKRYIKKPKSETKPNLENIDVEVRKMYDNTFFKEYLHIEENKINQFIYYAETHGLTQKMLNKGNEMQLIQFLMETAEHFEDGKD